MKWIAWAILSILVSISVMSIETANALLIGTKDLVVASFDWLFVGVASATVFVVALFGVLPRANIRLGPEDSKPEFSRFSWFSMLFSAGLASGLLYWAAAEPIIHYQGNPFSSFAGMASGSDAAMQAALRITIFHWGMHGWSMYVLGGLAIGIYSHRHGRPLTIRSSLYPLLGPRWIDRWPGRAVDLIALLGTVFGVATSVGLTAAALNSTLLPFSRLTLSAPMQIVIVFSVCALGVASAVSGIGRGIRRLSEINVWVSAVFLLAVFALGPTLGLVGTLLSSIVDYVAAFVPLGLWLGESPAEKQWQGAWTIFYWGWWLAWMPFVSLFIARISYGRTAREFVVAVTCAPTFVVIVWMSVLGGTALDQERTTPGAVSTAVNQDYALGTATVVGQLGSEDVGRVLTGIAAFLLFTWLITSLDSATLVITHILETPDPARQKALWGVILALVTSALIWVGGLAALQAASIIIGLPLAGVMILIGVGLLKDLVKGDL